ELAEGGQVELTTTPFYHPILPLLWDKRSARQAMPGCSLPKHLDPYPEDMRWHLQQAVELHSAVFGALPQGMWPSEGSVSQEIIAPVAEVGIQWIATDEEILAQSTNGWVSRDEHGHIRHPEMLYRPWSVSDGSRQLQIIFRDHALSDLIGFQYQRSDPVAAASDLLGRVESIGRAVESQNAGRPALVPIILDGENCWEYYPDGGVQFLRTLYQDAARRTTIQPVRVCDYLEAHPATDRIGRLFAGSWISHNFSIWIGHDEDNTAWDLLHRAREFLKRADAEGQEADREQRERAWREIYIAEGSDWYWWFGDDHSSAQDALFDQLFRRHLQNVYELLDQPAPPELRRPICRGGRRALHSQPTAFLPVQVDGQKRYFEWVNAGRYISGSERGTMTLVSAGLIRAIYFGFDEKNLFLRIDTAKSARDDLKALDELRVRFLEPPETEIRIQGFREDRLTAKLYRHQRSVAKAAVSVAVERILELSVLFRDLKRESEQPVQFYVEAFSNRQSVERAPREGVIELTVPSPDFEMIMWQV
ncbi:MAG TPA: alpha-amylase/alpha-mannosidase, partial [Planctomycetaceae bacterium]|nr:alpha-amylase/alpha-mannosidase [Planctomycetaceae bacterium]